MASMTYLEAIKAGVDIVDTCLAPFALRTSQPAVEPIVATLYRTARDPGFDLNLLLQMDDYLETIAPQYKDFLAKHSMSVIDTGVLAHQVPGGMISNLVHQLKEAKALDRLPEVYKEIAVTRKELGTPPLVTPTSQIVGVQAVLNVLFGRYKMVTNEVKDLVYGLYGKTPTPVNPDVQKKVLKNYKRGEKPVTGRAAEYLKPELEEARKRVGELARDDFDVLIYTPYPTTGKQFLKQQYEMEEGVSEVAPRAMKDITKEDHSMATAI
jgi:pyruvate/oxaloacetate carboxyltransferase